MTPQEAINIIEDVTWQDNGRHYGKIVPAREIAISALEKQIPKKVNISLKGTTGWNTKCYCPNCRSLISKGKYCYECGQALLWGDSE